MSKKVKASIKISKNGEINIGVPVQIYRDEETNLHVASCNALNLITQGKSVKEVKKNFEEVMDIFVEEYVSDKIKLKRYLEACGWELISQKTMNEKLVSLAVKSLVNSKIEIENLRLPASLLASA